MNCNSHRRPICSECDCYECEPDETECAECLSQNGSKKCGTCECWFDADELEKDENGNPICAECIRDGKDWDDTYNSLRNER